MTQQTETQLLMQELKTLINYLAPWMTRDDLMARYQVDDPHTITMMERRGEIPPRCTRTHWSRAQVLEWEASKRRGRAA